jgi:hypothetical protein
VTSPVDPNLAVVRALTDATTSDASDDTITALLAEAGGVAKLAAADVLELMATRLVSFESDDAKIDGSKQAKTLMDRAAALRQQHYEHGGDFYFDTAPLGPDQYAHLGTGWTDYQWGWDGPVI